jgi:hypothetical protein
MVKHGLNNEPSTSRMDINNTAQVEELIWVAETTFERLLIA